ncbi:MAG: hypothetical protein SH817_04720 [Leptospira sp.]|nr:hypothetical protein [Leptospira sp.]
MNSEDHNQKLKELFSLVYDNVPKLKLIENVLSDIHPAVLSNEIEKDVGFAYLMDYYLRFMDESLIKKILQNPLFSSKALSELFYCQITSIHKAKLLNRPIPELFSSYWKYLSKPQYAVLLKNAISRTWNLEPAKGLLSRIDLVHIKMLTLSGAVNQDEILNLFKSLGNDLTKVFSEDVNLYDYAFSLAVDKSDTEFLNFLESYTMVFVKLRIASSFVSEIEKSMTKKGGKLSYVELYHFATNIPSDTIDVCLEIFKEKEWLTQSEADQISKSFVSKNIK